MTYPSFSSDDRHEWNFEEERRGRLVPLVVAILMGIIVGIVGYFIFESF